ncbi:hypothetical protein FOA52_009906 [Chlamydomonas sp. UWO 241]|nr:hypothetical protein FOA52_009906 [Chlamydomonas sp. UWO 241]
MEEAELLSADPLTDEEGRAADVTATMGVELLEAAEGGHADAMRALLEHPAAVAGAMLMHSRKCDGFTALIVAGKNGHADAMRVLLDHPAAEAAAMLIHTSSHGSTALMYAAQQGHVDAMRVLLDHPSADPAMMIRAANNETTVTTLMYAAMDGHVEAIRVLLDHPSADPQSMMMVVDSRNGCTAFLYAALDGHADAMHMLLDHPASDAAAMLMHADSDGDNALMLVALQNGRVDTMRLLLNHSSADAAAMMMQTGSIGDTALMLAARFGHMDAMRLLLDHPAADVAAMLAVHTVAGTGCVSALLSAAKFAAKGSTDRMDTPSTSAVQTLSRDCAPLLLLLRRVAVDPSFDQQLHMTMVMSAMCDAPHSRKLLDDDQPDAVRDECVRLLLLHGARFDSGNPVMVRVGRELASWAWRFAGSG